MTIRGSKPLVRQIEQRGFYGIGIVKTKTEANIGTLWRSAFLYGASFIFTVGARYKPQSSDTFLTPRHLPCFNFECMEALINYLPYDAPLVGVELDTTAVALPEYQHRRSAVYLLGAEDHGLPKEVVNKCHDKIYIPSLVPHSLNVSVAGSIVMYSRFLQHSFCKE